MLTRRGATLVELMVAMSLAAIVLAAATASLVRQRSQADGSTARLRGESQIRGALAQLPQALQGLSAADGDLAAGEARDTALQLRMVVASGVACDSATGAAVLSADDSSSDHETGFATSPHPGDMLWWRAPGAATWAARRITDVQGVSGACLVSGPTVRPLLRMGLSASDTVSRDAVIRLTRQVRYSLYHAGDGTWQLGIAEWSDVLHAFAPPQPVAGPFARAAGQGTQSGFRYFDDAGSELLPSSQGVDVARVARVRFTIVARRTSDKTAANEMDSVDVAVQHAP